MAARRWLGTATVLAAMAWLLWTTGPTPADLRAGLADPQGLVDRSGADALVLLVVPVLAWACWAWGAVGLALTAASTAPGLLGRLAGLLLHGLLPAGARRMAATALGIGLSVAAPMALPLVAPSAAVATAAVVAEPASLPVTTWADWPAAGAVPDWPTAPAPAAAPDAHVVLRGDCLWDIAADWLQRQAPGTTPSAAAVLAAVHAWWQVNADVIGPDPDVVLPGQVLRPPG